MKYEFSIDSDVYSFKKFTHHRGKYRRVFSSMKLKIFQLLFLVSYWLVEVTQDEYCPTLRNFAGDKQLLNDKNCLRIIYRKETN